MILLKAFQKLGYFPAPEAIPGAIIPKGLAKLEVALHVRMPEQHLLDILCRMD